MTMKSSHYVVKVELIHIIHEEGEKGNPRNNYTDKPGRNEDVTIMRIALTDDKLNNAIAKALQVLEMHVDTDSE